MEAVFSVTDELGIHRESVTVPLGKQDPGQVSAKDGHVTIVVPESVPTATWVEEVLRPELAKLGYEELP
jgi:hypothetical protein